MHDTPAAIADALDQIGPRLRRVRTRRGLTLTGVAQATGISKSTLSRLETGGRKPTLELLLTLSHAYRVPLDDLVAAPEEGDPRIRLKPGRVKGRTVIPLTREPDGRQAWKIVIPTSKVTPEPRAHDGHEWIYVLSGNVRFVLGDTDRVLVAGDVAAFDTRIPHWFGSTGERPAEILSIFERPGERRELGPIDQEPARLIDHGPADPASPPSPEGPEEPRVFPGLSGRARPRGAGRRVR